MAYDRRTGIDLEAVRDLAARWNHLGDELERRRGDMYNSVSVIPWNGRAGNAMRDLWGNGSYGSDAGTVDHVLAQARDAAHGIASAINEYVADVEEVIEKMIKEEKLAVWLGVFDILISPLLMVFPIGQVIAALDGLISTVISRIIPVITRMVGMGSGLGIRAGEFVGPLISGTAINFGIDQITQIVGHAAIHEDYHPDWLGWTISGASAAGGGAAGAIGNHALGGSAGSRGIGAGSPRDIPHVSTGGVVHPDASPPMSIPAGAPRGRVPGTDGTLSAPQLNGLRASGDSAVPTGVVSSRGDTERPFGQAPAADVHDSGARGSGTEVLAANGGNASVAPTGGPRSGSSTPASEPPRLDGTPHEHDSLVVGRSGPARPANGDPVPSALGRSGAGPGGAVEAGSPAGPASARPGVGAAKPGTSGGGDRAAPADVAPRPVGPERPGAGAGKAGDAGPGATGTARPASARPGVDAAKPGTSRAGETAHPAETDLGSPSRETSARLTDNAGPKAGGPGGAAGGRKDSSAGPPSRTQGQKDEVAKEVTPAADLGEDVPPGVVRPHEQLTGGSSRAGDGGAPKPPSRQGPGASAEAPKQAAGVPRDGSATPNEVAGVDSATPVRARPAGETDAGGQPSTFGTARRESAGTNGRPSDRGGTGADAAGGGDRSGGGDSGAPARTADQADLHNARETLRTLRGKDFQGAGDAAGRLEADGQDLARYFDGMKEAKGSSKFTLHEWGDLFAGELLSKGYDRTIEYAARQFGVDVEHLPSSAVLNGIRERAELDPQRARAVLSMRDDHLRYVRAARGLLKEFEDSAGLKAPELNLVAAKIAQGSITDLRLEAGRPLAGKLVSGEVRSLRHGSSGGAGIGAPKTPSQQGPGASAEEPRSDVGTSRDGSAVDTARRESAGRPSGGGRTGAGTDAAGGGIRPGVEGRTPEPGDLQYARERLRTLEADPATLQNGKAHVARQVQDDGRDLAEYLGGMPSTKKPSNFTLQEWGDLFASQLLHLGFDRTVEYAARQFGVDVRHLSSSEVLNGIRERAELDPDRARAVLRTVDSRTSAKGIDAARELIAELRGQHDTTLLRDERHLVAAKIAQARYHHQGLVIRDINPEAGRPFAEDLVSGKTHPLRHESSDGGAVPGRTESSGITDDSSQAGTGDAPKTPPREGPGASAETPRGDVETSQTDAARPHEGPTDDPGRAATGSAPSTPRAEHGAGAEALRSDAESPRAGSAGPKGVAGKGGAAPARPASSKPGGFSGGVEEANKLISRLTKLGGEFESSPKGEELNIRDQVARAFRNGGLKAAEARARELLRPRPARPNRPPGAVEKEPGGSVLDKGGAAPGASKQKARPDIASEEAKAARAARLKRFERGGPRGAVEKEALSTEGAEEVAAGKASSADPPSGKGPASSDEARPGASSAALESPPVDRTAPRNDQANAGSPRAGSAEPPNAGGHQSTERRQLFRTDRVTGNSDLVDVVERRSGWEHTGAGIRLGRAADEMDPGQMPSGPVEKASGSDSDAMPLDTDVEPLVRGGGRLGEPPADRYPRARPGSAERPSGSEVEPSEVRPSDSGAEPLVRGGGRLGEPPADRYPRARPGSAERPSGPVEETSGSGAEPLVGGGGRLGEPPADRHLRARPGSAERPSGSGEEPSEVMPSGSDVDPLVGGGGRLGEPPADRYRRARLGSAERPSGSAEETSGSGSGGKRSGSEAEPLVGGGGRLGEPPADRYRRARTGSAERPSGSDAEPLAERPSGSEVEPPAERPSGPAEKPAVGNRPDRPTTEEHSGSSRQTDRYDYYEIDPLTGDVTRTHLASNDVVVEVRPASGQVAADGALKVFDRDGKPISVGEPGERMAAYDHDKGTWEVVTVKRDASAGPHGEDPALPGRTPASGKDESGPYQVLRRDSEGNVDLLTYERRPPDVPPADRYKNDGYQYYELNGSGHEGWHNAYPFGTPEVERITTGASRQNGKPAMLVRDQVTGRFEKVPAVSSEHTGPPSRAGRTYYRIGADGKPELVRVRGDKLDIIRVSADGEEIAHTTFSPSGDGTALPHVGQNGELSWPSAQKIPAAELRFDPDTERITHAPGERHSTGDSGSGSPSGPGKGSGSPGGLNTAARPETGGSRTQTVADQRTFVEDRTVTEDEAGGGPEPLPDKADADGEASDKPSDVEVAQKTTTDQRSEVEEAGTGGPSGEPAVVDGGVRSPGADGTGGTGGARASGDGGATAIRPPRTGSVAVESPRAAGGEAPRPEAAAEPGVSGEARPGGSASVGSDGEVPRSDAAAGADSGPEIRPGGAGPAVESLTQQQLDDTRQTLVMVRRQNPAAATQVVVDGLALGDEFARAAGVGLSAAGRVDVGEVLGAELVWAGFDGAVQLGERLFGVDVGRLPFPEALEGIHQRAELDPDRAEAVLSLRVGSERFTNAAQDVLRGEGVVEPSEDAVRLVAAKIAQRFISDVIPEAGRPLAGALRSGAVHPLPSASPDVGTDAEAGAPATDGARPGDDAASAGPDSGGVAGQEPPRPESATSGGSPLPGRGHEARPSSSGPSRGQVEPGTPNPHRGPFARSPRRSPELVMGGGAGDRVEVPRVLHTVWLGANGLGDHARHNLTAWRERAQESGWTTVMWVDRESVEKDEEFLATFRSHPAVEVRVVDRELFGNGEPASSDGLAQWEVYRYASERQGYAMASDVVRYAVLRRFGGVYVDTDIGPGAVVLPREPLRMPVGRGSMPFVGPLLRDQISIERARAHYAQRGERLDGPDQLAKAARLYYEYGLFNNNFIVTPPNSVFLEELYRGIPGDDLLARMRDPDFDVKEFAARHTGPVLWQNKFSPDGPAADRRSGAPLREAPDTRPEIDHDMLRQWIDLEWVTPESNRHESRSASFGDTADWQGLLADAPVHQRRASGPVASETADLGFDVRRVERAGERLTEITIRLRLRPALDVSAEQLEDVWRRQHMGVYRSFNAPRHRLPQGDLLAVNIVPAGADTPHLTVDVVAHAAVMTPRTWVIGQPGGAYAYLLGHQLGLDIRSAEGRQQSDLRRPHLEQLGRLVGDIPAHAAPDVDVARETVEWLRRVDPEAAEELLADAGTLAERFGGIPGATPTDLEAWNLEDLFAHELVRNAYEGALRFGERLFGVSARDLPSPEELHGIVDRNLLDPRRAELVLSLEDPEPFRAAARGLLTEPGDHPDAASPALAPDDQVSLVAARIAQNSSGRPDVEAGRRLAEILRQGIVEPIRSASRQADHAGDRLEWQKSGHSRTEFCVEVAVAREGQLEGDRVRRC